MAAVVGAIVLAVVGAAGAVAVVVVAVAVVVVVAVAVVCAWINNRLTCHQIGAPSLNTRVFIPCHHRRHCHPWPWMVHDLEHVQSCVPDDWPCT